MATATRTPPPAAKARRGAPLATPTDLDREGTRNDTETFGGIRESGQGMATSEREAVAAEVPCEPSHEVTLSHAFVIDFQCLSRSAINSARCRFAEAYSLAEEAQAHARVERGHVLGSVVLKIRSRTVPPRQLRGS